MAKTIKQPAAKPKVISRTVYLQALGLFTMANQHMLNAQRFERELGRLLGMKEDGPGDLGWISDAMFEDRPDFDAALKKSGYVMRQKDK